MKKTLTVWILALSLGSFILGCGRSVPQSIPHAEGQPQPPPPAEGEPDDPAPSFID